MPAFRALIVTFLTLLAFLVGDPPARAAGFVGGAQSGVESTNGIQPEVARRSVSGGITLGLVEGGFTVGADASWSSSKSVIFSNASMQGDDIILSSGEDLGIFGANIFGRNVSLDAGRDLILSSQQNVAKSGGGSFGLGLTLSTSGVPLGASVSGTFVNTSRVYTDTPTTVVADESLDLFAGGTTVLSGARAWSKTGKLRLDTGNFVFNNYKDRDVSKSGGIQIGVSFNRPLA